MSLYLATLITGLSLAFFGAFLLLKPTVSEKALKAFPRSQIATYVLMAIAVSWFSLRIYNLTPSDFGEHKDLLLMLFLSIAVASFYFVPDFLSARALAGCILLLSDVLLDAAFMQAPTSRLFLVSYVYFMVLIAFVLGASPYLLKDWFNWLFKRSGRLKLVSGALLSYGVLLVTIAVTY